MILLLGRDSSDPLFLQAKEASRSVLERFVGRSEFSNQGQRVVEGQRLMQSASDIFLGWLRQPLGPAIFGFLPPSDQRLHATVLAVADELSEQGFVLRYHTEQTDDGLSGKEGTFVICSFWLVSALAIIGEMQRARTLMERLVKAASPLGVYAEEFDVETGRHLGNFPHAFSHLALVEAAARIIVAEGLAEVAG